MEESNPRISTTIFLVSNFDCPSYVSRIKDALYVLRPEPISVSPSIVSQYVTVRHNPSLSEATMSKALMEAGFDIYSVIHDP
jgi:hypothetical protein